MCKLSIILLHLLALKSFAVEVPNLYQHPVLVFSQSKEERQYIVPQVLRQVILKVVGDRSALDVINLSPILDQANILVERFQYVRMNEINEGVTYQNSLELLFKFNEVALEKLLANFGLFTWGHVRPDILVWIAMDDDGYRKIIGTYDGEYNISTLVKNSAKLRGLPIFMPIIDLQDYSEVKFIDIWKGYFSKSIRIASQRYAPEVIIIGRISIQNNLNCQIYWRALINNKSESWQSKGELRTALTAGIEELIDRLARHATKLIINKHNKNVLLQINNISNYADFSRLINYLSKIQYVSQLRLFGLSAGRINIMISLEVRKKVFDKVLDGGLVLRKEDNIYNASEDSHYRMLP